MPKISYNKSGGGVITWDQQDFLAGLHPQYGTATGQYQKGGNFLWLSGNFDPYRYLGYVAPTYDSTTAITNSNVVDGTLLNVAVNSSYGYLPSTSAKLHRMDLSVPSFSNSGDWPHSITAHGGHSTVIGNDIAVYTAKVGGTSATRLFYSWSDDTDWDVGTYDFASAFDDDFMSTAPATPLASPYLTGGKRQPHPLVVGHDDILYIGDRNFVHAYDGANSADNDGKFFPAVLTLPNNYIITSMVKYDPRSLVVFAYNNAPTTTTNTTGFYSGQSTAFFWDYLALDPYNVVQLNDNYVDAGFSYNGTVGCFTSGRQTDFQNGSRISKLQLYNGSQFKQQVAYIGNVPSKGGVDIVGDQIQWISNIDTSFLVYSWGNQYGEKKVLNSPSSIANTNNTAIGVLRSLTTVFQMGAIGDGSLTVQGTQGSAVNLSSRTTYSSSTQIRTSLAYPNFPSGYKGQIKNVTVNYAKSSTGGRQVSLGFFDEVNTQSTVVSSVIEIPSTATTFRAEQLANNNPLPQFSGLQLFIAYGNGSANIDAPIISSVSAEFQEVQVTTTQ